MTNSDPGIILFSKRYLDKLGYDSYVTLYIYNNQAVEKIEESWREVGLDIKKTYIKKMRSKHRLYSKSGVARLYVNNPFEIFHSVMT